MILKSKYILSGIVLFYTKYHVNIISSENSDLNMFLKEMVDLIEKLRGDKESFLEPSKSFKDQKNVVIIDSSLGKISDSVKRSEFVNIFNNLKWLGDIPISIQVGNWRSSSFKKSQYPSARESQHDVEW